MIYIRTKNIKQQSFFVTYSIFIYEERLMPILFLFAMLIYSADLFAVEIKVIDGDSIYLDRQEIRLEGIDAPEYHQQCYNENGKLYDCGRKAFKALKLILKEDVVCKTVAKDRYKRKVAVCYSGGKNLNEEMVKQGWAVAYDRYTDDYVDDEKTAKNGKKGLWQGKFMRPELYRSLHRD